MRGTWKTEEADIQGKLTRGAQRQDHAPHIRGPPVPLQSASRAEEKAHVGCSPPPTLFPQLQVSPLPSLPGPATPKDKGLTFIPLFLGTSILLVWVGPTSFQVLIYHFFMPIYCYTNPFPAPPEAIIYILSRCIFIGMCSCNIYITVLCVCIYC